MYSVKNLKGYLKNRFRLSATFRLFTTLYLFLQGRRRAYWQYVWVDRSLSHSSSSKDIRSLSHRRPGDSQIPDRMSHSTLWQIMYSISQLSIFGNSSNRRNRLLKNSATLSHEKVQFESVAMGKSKPSEAAATPPSQRHMSDLLKTSSEFTRCQNRWGKLFWNISASLLQIRRQHRERCYWKNCGAKIHYSSTDNRLTQYSQLENSPNLLAMHNWFVKISAGKWYFDLIYVSTVDNRSIRLCSLQSYCTVYEPMMSLLFKIDPYQRTWFCTLSLLVIGHIQNSPSARSRNACTRIRCDARHSTLQEGPHKKRMTFTIVSLLTKTGKRKTITNSQNAKVIDRAISQNFKKL